jgi:hypothetical protein
MLAVVQPPERVLKLQQVAPPTVGDDGVLVRVRATSVNTPDWLVVTGVPYVLRLRSGPAPEDPSRGLQTLMNRSAVSMSPATSGGVTHWPPIAARSSSVASRATAHAFQT